MTTKLDEIVKINISVSDTSITRQGFGTGLILGESIKLTTRVKGYANMTDVAADFATTDIEYKMAATYLQQQLTSPIVYIGKKVTSLTPAVVTSINIVDIVSLEGSGPYDFFVVANGLGDLAEIGCSLQLAGVVQTEFNGSHEVAEVIDSDTIVIRLNSTPSTPTPDVSSATYVLLEGWGEAVNSCFAANSDWYGLVISSTVTNDITTVAAATEPIKRLFIARTSDADNLDAFSTTSVSYLLKQSNYDRTALIYNSNTTDQFVDAAWLGRMLPTEPGSSNWSYKSLIGPVSDKLTSAETNFLFSNHVNTYETINGVPIIRQGYVASGEYIDIIRGIDWLRVRMQEAVYLLLINNAKIPFTDEGGAIIESAMRSVLTIGANNGLIAQDANGNGIFTVTAPLVANIPEINRIDRFFSDIKFTARLAGAINKVGIEGNLSV